MRAVRCTERGIECVEVDPPPRTEANSVRLRPRSAGICGTDVTFAKALGPRPITFGHEFAGLLDDGTPVAIMPLPYCGTCDNCQRGLHNCCLAGMGGNYGLAVDGGMAEELHVAPHCLVPLAGGLAPEDACLVEPTGVAAHGLRLAGTRSGQRVAVVGGGSIGLIGAALAQYLGAESVVIARHPAQFKAAESMGIRAVRDGDASLVDGTFDVVLEAAGTESATARSVDLAAPGGTVSVVGVHMTTMNVPFTVALTKELRIVASMAYGLHGGGRDIDNAAALLASHPAWAKAIITHRFPLEDATEAFRVAEDRASGAIKVVLQP